MFRIASSNAIATFKSNQSNAFIQLARSELCFDVSAREVVLLEYDRASQWLFKIEKILQSIGEEEIQSQLKIAIIESFREEIIAIETILNIFKDVFDDNVVEFIKLIHSYAFEYAVEEMEECINGKIDRCFIALTEVLMHYLQHILFCLHEYNNNMIVKSETPFLSVGNFCLRKNGEKKFEPIRKRINYFKKYIKDKTYVLKIYSDENIFTDAVNFTRDLNIFLIEEDHNKT